MNTIYKNKEIIQKNKIAFKPTEREKKAVEYK
jgi:hypothetical protein